MKIRIHFIDGETIDTAIPAITLLTDFINKISAYKFATFPIDDKKNISISVDNVMYIEEV